MAGMVTVTTNERQEITDISGECTRCGVALTPETLGSIKVDARIRMPHEFGNPCTVDEIFPRAYSALCRECYQLTA